MNKGVTLLLKRMESHPEEFEDRYDSPYEQSGKWDAIINQLCHRVEIIDHDNGHGDTPGVARPARYGKPLGYLSDEEVLTLFTKLEEARAKVFERRVMKLLLADEYRNIYAQAVTWPVGSRRPTLAILDEASNYPDHPDAEPR